METVQGVTWFNVKVRYTKQTDDGNLKVVTEPYLLSAVTFGNAEDRIYEELGSVIRGEFSVEAISKFKVHDIFEYDDNDVWYQVQLDYDGVDDHSGKAKKIKHIILVTADSTKQAYDRVEESVKELYGVIELPKIMKTDIVDIFPFNSDQDEA